MIIIFATYYHSYYICIKQVSKNSSFILVQILLGGGIGKHTSLSRWRRIGKPETANYSLKVRLLPQQQFYEYIELVEKSGPG
jgi:hypothetical protein